MRALEPKVTAWTVPISGGTRFTPFLKLTLTVMDSLPHPESVRDLVLRTFSQLRGQVLQRGALSETILIRQEHYLGRAYRSGRLLATLVAETSTLTFYDESGQLLHTVALAERQQKDRKAA